MDVREKLVELPIDDAILILREEHRWRTDGYTTYLAHGGKGDPAEEVGLDALAMAISALEKQSGFRLMTGCQKKKLIVLFITSTLIVTMMIIGQSECVFMMARNFSLARHIKSHTGCRCHIRRKENDYV